MQSSMHGSHDWSLIRLKARLVKRVEFQGSFWMLSPGLSQHGFFAEMSDLRSCVELFRTLVVSCFEFPR